MWATKMQISMLHLFRERAYENQHALYNGLKKDTAIRLGKHLMMLLESNSHSSCIECNVINVEMAAHL